ncbi:MAG: acyl carrier protein [Anaerolineales bacterium]|nr:acyl carrier protein [Anaerolineales bacterium]
MTSPSPETLLQTLSDYVAAQIMKQPGALLSPHEPLISSGLIDSFSLVDIALFIEATFGVRIEDTELNRDTFDTLDELASLILSRRQP